jgi:hypothetical protein
METTMKKECFIICPIGPEGSESRNRSDKIFKHLFQPVLEEFGYNPIRADQIDKVGNITSQIIDFLVETPLVIADLSEHNPNVFYELGIRHTVRKPYIQFIAKGDRLPFDVAAIRSIEIDHTDLDSVESAKKILRNQIRAYEEGADVDSPVSVALDLKSLRLDNSVAERLLKEMYNLKNQLKETESNIQAMIVAMS